MKKLLIYGASFVDTVKLIHAINARKRTWKIVGFIDDDRELADTSVCEYRVLGDFEYLKKYISRFPDAYIFNNVNSSVATHILIGERMDALRAPIASLVHPDVNTEYVTMGKGAFIPQGCVLGCNVVIGNYVTFRYGAVVSHDVKIRDYVFVGPGSVCTSDAILERGSYLGACCTIINGVTVGENSVVGASTLVNKPVRPNVTVVGVPARELDV